MLIIRNAQKVAFLSGFVPWASAYLCATRSAESFVGIAPEGGGLNAAVQPLVVKVCERGLASGFDDATLLFRLIMIVFTAGPALLDDPETVRILASRRQSADRRLDDLANYAQRSR